MSELKNIPEEGDAVNSDWEEMVREAGTQDSNERGDIIADGLLLFFGAYVFFKAINMPAQTLSGGLWYVAPGIFPAFLGVLLCVLSLYQGIEAMIKLRARKRSDVDVRAEKRWSRPYTIDFLVIAVLLCCYIFLLGVIPYRLVTFAFLAISMLYYDSKHTWRRIVIDLVVSLIVSLLVAYAFETMARIPLP